MSQNWWLQSRHCTRTREGLVHGHSHRIIILVLWLIINLVYNWFWWVYDFLAHWRLFTLILHLQSRIVYLKSYHFLLSLIINQSILMLLTISGRLTGQLIFLLTIKLFHENICISVCVELSCFFVLNFNSIIQKIL